MNDMELVKNYFEILIATWRKGDVDKSDDMMVTELKISMPVLYKRILSDRGGNWLPLIEAYFKTSRREFAAHLAGPNGITTNLKQQGYIVEKF